MPKDSNAFEITYGPPWKGIDASMPTQEIDRSSFPFDAQWYTNNGNAGVAPFGDYNYLLLDNYIYPQINFNNDFGALISGYDGTQPYILTSVKGSDGKKYTLIISATNVYKFAANSGNLTNLGALPVTITSNTIGYTLAIQNILYFTGTNGIGKVDPVAATVGQLTNFSGAIYINELNGHVLLGSTIEGGVSHQGRIRWSGVNNFSQFDSSVDATAGFNDLPDVSDSITGIFCFDSGIGYILRETGITQIIPGNLGTTPFQFNHLWRANEGIGCFYPYTASQYGSLGVFVSRDDIYTLSTSGLKPIGGKARNFIYSDLNSIAGWATNANIPITGQIVPYIDNNTRIVPNPNAGGYGLPQLSYILTIPIFVGPFSVAWIYNFNTETWSRCLGMQSPRTLITNVVDSQNNSVYKSLFGPGYTAYGYNNTQSPRIGMNYLNLTPTTLCNFPPSLYFKVECPAVGRKFTVRRIAIEYSWPTYTVTNRTEVWNVILDALDNPAPSSSTQYRMLTTLKSSNQVATALIDQVCTAERFQLRINGNTNFNSARIHRVTLFCNYADEGLL